MEAHKAFLPTKRTLSGGFFLFTLKLYPVIYSSLQSKTTPEGVVKGSLATFILEDLDLLNGILLQFSEADC